MTLQEANERAWESADDFMSLTTAVQIGMRLWPSVESFERAVEEIGNADGGCKK